MINPLQLPLVYVRQIKLSATYRSPGTDGVQKAPSQRTAGNIYVIDPKNTNAWAILPEILFIDHATDIPKLKSSSQRQHAADTIAFRSQFICSYTTSH